MGGPFNRSHVKSQVQIPLNPPPPTKKNIFPALPWYSQQCYGSGSIEPSLDLSLKNFFGSGLQSTIYRVHYDCDVFDVRDVLDDCGVNDGLDTYTYVRNGRTRFCWPVS